MTVTLMRITPPDSKIYLGEALNYPEPGGCFMLVHSGTRLLQTSVIKSVSVLPDGTVEFNTLNSTYRLYEDTNAIRN